MQGEKMQIDFKNNSLNLIRLLGAFQVMLIHCTTHLQLELPSIIKIIVTYFRGVPIFFGMSGFLIWRSIGNSGCYSKYLKKRFFRIYPELWCGVIIEMIVLMIMYNKYKIKELVVFSFCQSTVLQFYTPDSLRNYGCGTPNGALWTICVMIQFYIVAWLIYKIVHAKKIHVAMFVFVFSILISFCGDYIISRFGSQILVRLFDQTILRYLWLFMIGCILAEYYDCFIYTIKRYWYVPLSFGLVLHLINVDVYLIYGVFNSILLIVGLIGYAYSFPSINVKTDISYGIYIYHMTGVNALITLGYTHSYIAMLVCFGITCIVAWISTKTIGDFAVKRSHS